MEKVKVKEIKPDDKYGIAALAVGEIIENRCKPKERDDLSKRIRGVIQHYAKTLGRTFTTKKTQLGIAIKRTA